MRYIKILNWSQMTMDNVRMYPILFFTPTIDILSYINQYGYDVVIEIIGTQDLYDGVYKARFNIANLNSENTTVDFNTTQPVYSIILDGIFTLYPKEKGKFKIYNNVPTKYSLPILKTIKEEDDNTQTNIVENYEKEKKDSSKKEEMVEIPLNEDLTDYEVLQSENSIYDSNLSPQTVRIKKTLYTLIFLFFFIFVILLIFIFTSK
jgi:hypothetical protein